MLCYSSCSERKKTFLFLYFPNEAYVLGSLRPGGVNTNH